MPKNLEKVKDEPNLLIQRDRRIYYTNYWDDELKDLRKSTGETDLVKAKKVAKKMHRDWLRDKSRPLEEALFEDIALEVLENKSASGKKKSYLSAKNQFKHLAKYFMGMQWKDIDKTTWADYVTFCRRDNAKRNLNDDLKYFLICYNNALAKGIVARSLKIKKPDIEGEVGRELPDKEIKLIFERAIGDTRLQVEAALRLGWRKREGLKCRKEFCDFKKLTIKLPPTFTKTKKGREFPVPVDLMAKFRAQFEAKNSQFLYPSPSNPLEPIDDNKSAWYYITGHLAEKDKAKRVTIDARWHDLRHTCATRMIRAGVSDSHVSKFLGMSRKVLSRIYSHVNINDLRPAADAVKLGELMMNG